MSTLKIFAEPLRVINIGVEGFAEDLKAAGVEVIQLDWRPRRVVNARLTVPAGESARRRVTSRTRIRSRPSFLLRWQVAPPTAGSRRAAWCCDASTGKGMMLNPVPGDVDPPADPDIRMLRHIIEESLQTRRP